MLRGGGGLGLGVGLGVRGWGIRRFAHSRCAVAGRLRMPSDLSRLRCLNHRQPRAGLAGAGSEPRLPLPALARRPTPNTFGTATPQIIPLHGPQSFAPVLACRDSVLRVLDAAGRAPLFEVPAPSPPTALLHVADSHDPRHRWGHGGGRGHVMPGQLVKPGGAGQRSGAPACCTLANSAHKTEAGAPERAPAFDRWEWVPSHPIPSHSTAVPSCYPPEKGSPPAPSSSCTAARTAAWSSWRWSRARCGRASPSRHRRGAVRCGRCTAGRTTAGWVGWGRGAAGRGLHTAAARTGARGKARRVRVTGRAGSWPVRAHCKMHSLQCTCRRRRKQLRGTSSDAVQGTQQARRLETRRPRLHPARSPAAPTS